MATAKLGVTISAKDNASGTLSKVAGSMNVLKNIALAEAFLDIASAAADGLKALVDFAKAGDEVAKSARRIGASAEEFSRLSHAASMSGASAKDVEKSFLFMGKTISSMPAYYKKWGVAVKDSNGQLLSSEEVFANVADKISKLPPGIQQTAAAQELLGRSGANLLPLMQEGAEGVQALKDEADALGITISNVEAALSEQFSDSMDRANGTLTAMGRAISTELLPYAIAIADAITQVVADTLNWAKANREVINSGIIEFFDFIATSAIPGVLVGANLMQMSFNGLQLVFYALKATAETVFLGLLSGINEVVAAAQGAVSIFNKDAAAKMAGNELVQSFKIAQESIREELAESEKALYANKRDLEQNEAALANFGVSFAEKIGSIQLAAKAALGKASLSMPAGAGVGGGDRTTKPQNRPGLDSEGFAAGDDAIGFSSGMTLSAAMKQDEEAKKQAITDEKNRLARQKKEEDAQKNLIKAQEAAARQISGPLSSALMGMAFHGRSAGDALMALAEKLAGSLLDSAISGLVKGATAAFGIPLPFASGGLVPGSGGGDTVPALLTPGEFVLTKPIVEAIRGGRKPSMPGRFADGGLVTAGAGAGMGTVILNMNSAAPPNTATLRRDIVSGLAPVLDGLTRNNAYRTGKRIAGRRT